MKHATWYHILNILLLTTSFNSINFLLAEETILYRNNNGARSKITAINARNFMGNSTTVSVSQMYTTQGKYYLVTEDIVFTGTATPFVITADNITIDLNGYTISYTGTTDDVHGFDITGKNIVIKNGSIEGFTGDAIRIQDNSKSVTLENIRISGGGATAGSRGISLEGTAVTNDTTKVLNCVISNCTIENCDSIEAGESYACKIAYAQNIIIENCNFLRSKGGTGFDAYGLWINASQNIQIKNCYSAGHEGSRSFGYYLEGNSRACLFENCTASGCSATTGIAVGFYSDSSHSNLFNDCKSMGHESVKSAFGFYMNASYYNTLTNCYSAYCRDTGLTASNVTAGFYSLNGLGNSWKHCESIGHQGANIATGTVAGFQLSGTEKQSAWLSCTARANGSLTNSAAAGHGFYISHANTVDYCQIQHCQAIANCSSTANAAYGFRDISERQTTNMFLDNFAFGNTDANANTDNYNVAIAVGTFPELSADIGGLLDLANQPPYYNIGISS